MILIFSIVLIAVLSIGYSYYTIRQDIKKGKYRKDVQQELQKGRVVYYSDTVKKEDQEETKKE